MTEWRMVDGVCTGCGSHLVDGIDEHMAAHQRGQARAQKAVGNQNEPSPQPPLSPVNTLIGVEEFLDWCSE